MENGPTRSLPLPVLTPFADLHQFGQQTMCSSKTNYCMTLTVRRRDGGGGVGLAK
jgi:hypothetical protein